MVGGCATNYGNTAITDDKKMSSIQIGKSTTKDVESTLGKPGYVELAESGEQVWTYQNINVKGTAMIPFAAMFGGTMKEKNFVVRFTKKGIVKSVGSGENQM